MKENLHSIVYAIPVPTDLNAAVLTACREELRRQQSAAAPLRVVRYIPAAATAAVCVTVLGVALYTGGHNPGGAPVVPPMGDDGSTVTTITTDRDVEQTTDMTAATITATTTTATATTTTTRTTKTVSSTISSTTAAQTTRPSVGGIPTKEMGLLRVSTFQEMTAAELEAHYGQKVIPVWLPEGLELRLDPNLPLGVYTKDAALIAENQDRWNNLLSIGIARDAAVVYDCNQLRWCDFIDGRRELTVYIATAPYPSYKLGDMTRFDDPLTVAGTTVQAAYFEDSADCWCWSALLPKGNIEYYIEGWNISKNEITRILESLIP